MTRFDIPAESELRIKIGSNHGVCIQLLYGTAEIFGTSLPLNHRIQFPDSQNFAVFTWTGATVELQGRTDACYISNMTPMTSYQEIHRMLNGERSRARQTSSASTGSFNGSPLIKGPRVIIVGPTDSGKSTLSKILLGWATRDGWKPIFVDLDVGQGSLTIPGTLAATPVDVPVDPVVGIPMRYPLVYFFGHNSPSNNPSLYVSMLRELSNAVTLSNANNQETSSSGIIINTLGWVEGLGYELMINAVENFSANIIIVFDEDQLHRRMCDQFRDKPAIHVISICRSDGVVTRPKRQRQLARNSRIREYFYGIFNNLYPIQTSVNFNEVFIFHVESHPEFKDLLQVIPFTVRKDIVGSVLAISYAKEPKELISCNVAGFIYVTDVEFSQMKLSYISPCPGPLPSNLLLIGSVFWDNPNMRLKQNSYARCVSKISSNS